MSAQAALLAASGSSPASGCPDSTQAESLVNIAMNDDATASCLPNSVLY